MPSTIKTDIIQTNNSTAGTPPQFNDINGTQIGTLSRAWANLNGATPALRASFNISSLTKNATGDWTLTFTNSFIDASYAVGTMGCASNAFISGFKDNSTAPTLSAVRLATLSGGFTDANSNYTTWNFNR